MALDLTKCPHFVLVCTHCTGALLLSPSDWFCGEPCQQAWLQKLAQVPEPIAKVVQFPVGHPPPAALGPAAIWGVC